MNQQQLQTARAALWHQTAPLLTADEAAAWLEDLGLCLFLPRHAQLPAPAPSFVEAVHGAASTTPPAAALKQAGELATRLVDDRRVVPLNLLGTYAEQPDFLITPEVLPWVSATRGDRQWNAAPGGRTAPLVVRTWQALDREGEATAVELREHLGRELTEAAVLRALIELWTTLRAMPVYRQGEPTRWTLLKNRFPAQLSTGANTAQATALSALLSIYLRSAVAATAEEAEIFLSPLTARSRIREVIHGMTAARQFGSMSVASQTLLFVEGSLPEDLPVEEPIAAEPAAPAEKPQRAPRREFQDKRRPFRAPDSNRQEPRPSFRDRPKKREDAKPWQKRREFRGPQRPPRPERPSAEAREREQRKPESRPRFTDRREKRGDAKPWQKRRESRGPQRPAREERPSTESRSGDRGKSRRESRPWDRGERRPGSRPPMGAKPWQRRKDAATGQGGEQRQRFDHEREERPRRFDGEKPSDQKFRKGSGPRGDRFSAPGGFGRKSSEAKPVGGSRPTFGGSRPKFSGPRPKFPPKREGGTAQREEPRSGDRRPPFGKPQRREDSRRPFVRSKNFAGPGKKNFRKANPGRRNPRKNRNQEDASE